MTNFLIRSLVAVVAIPALLWIFHEGDWWLRGLVVALIGLSCLEIRIVTKSHDVPYSFPIGVLLSMAIPLVVVSGGDYAWPVWAVAALTAAGAFGIIQRNAMDAAMTVLIHVASALWIGFGFGALLMLRDLITGDGFRWLVFLYVNLWIGDTAAYLFGSWIGGPKLAPVISPKKTIAGSVAQVLTSVTIGIVYVLTGWIDAPASLLIVGAVAIGVIGQVGDLFESVFKRAMGVKDFSSIIPGHGGVLDRFDSTLLAAPALWAIIILWTHV
ncbi:MAG: phosphatidate cytidylyltransferase [Candidatus Zixiibacteriota bacterium]